MNVQLKKRFGKFSLIKVNDEEAVVANEGLEQNGDQWRLLSELEKPLGDEPVFVQKQRDLPAWLTGVSI